MADLNEKSLLISTAIPNPEQREAVKEYSSKAMALIKGAGGTVLGRHPIVKNILGENPPGVVLLAEFPNDQAILDLFESEAYKQLIPVRDVGFKNITLHIAR